MHPLSFARVSRLACLSLVCLALTLVAAQPAVASSWSGTVTDESGTALPGVEVTLTYLMEPDWMEWVTVDEDLTDLSGAYYVTHSGFRSFNEYELTFHDPTGAHHDYVAAVGDPTDWGSFTLDVIMKSTDAWPDTTPPVTTDNAPKGWVTTPEHLNMAVKVTLTATDDLSGVAGTWYRVNGGDWLQGTTLNFAIRADHSADGIWSIEYYSVDVAGNVEPLKGCYVRIDTTEPAASLPAVQYSTGTVQLSVLDKLSPTCTVRIEMLRSGMKLRKHARDEVVATFVVQVPADGSLQTADLPSDVDSRWYSLRATATDLAGNVQATAATGVVHFKR